MTTSAADAVERGWVPSDESFSARLALVRNRLGWNMKEAALACGLPPSSWMHWESDGKHPRNYTDVCQTISARTGADYAWLALGRTSQASGSTLTANKDTSQWRKALLAPTAVPVAA
jgi:hypothetical protein